MTGDADRDGIGGDTPQADDKPDRPELDIDAAFDALAKQFLVPTPDGAHDWPAAEDLGPDDALTVPTDPAGAAPTRPGAGQARPEVSLEPTERTDGSSAADRLSGTDRLSGSDRRSGSDRAGGDRAEVLGRGDRAPEPLYPRELDDHYVPPEPPPLPRGDLVSRLAWSGVIGGPLFLLFAALVGGDLPAWMLLSALGAFIGGFVTLVARMPGEPPEDRDDGAVV